MWKGFLIESKSYMSYEKMNQKEKVSFWFRFPFKWLGFQWLCVKDSVLMSWRKLTLRAVDGVCTHPNYKPDENIWCPDCGVRVNDDPATNA